MGLVGDALGVLSGIGWARLFGSGWTIAGFSVVILLWAVIAAFRLRRGVREFRRSVDNSTGALVATPGRPRDFAASYETTATVLQDAPVVGPAWRDWSATVITPEVVGTPVRSTSRAGSYFSLDLLRYCGINLRLHAAMPNLLVGVGLLLTFVGLALALSSAGDIVGGKDAGGRNDALKQLLDVASAKFVTSLVGLLCSLAYTAFRAGQLDRAERALDRFLAALEERIPLATPATLQADSNRHLENLVAAQNQFGNELAVNIGGLLDNAFDKRLGEHIGPLREAIEKLSEGIGNKGEETLRVLVEEFRQMLQGSAQAHMEKLANALASTSDGMEQIRTGLTEAADRMADAAGKVSEQMGRNAEQAMAGITRQMDALLAELRSLAEQSRAAGNDAMAQAADRIARAGESFDQAARGIAASLEQTVQGITTRLSGEAEAATRRMTEELGNAVVALRELAERSHSEGDAATRAMAERIGQAAASFEQSAGKVAQALENGAGDAAGRLTAAVEGLRTEFTRITGDLAGNLQTAGLQFAEQGRGGAAALTQAAEAAATALKAGGQESGESLRQGGADAGRGLQAAASELATPSRELAQRIASLQNEAQQLAGSLSVMQRALVEATAPVRAATADLVRQGASSEKATADLATAAGRVAPLVDVFDRALRQLSDTGRRLETLSADFDKALAHFRGLDESLGRVFKGVSDNLGSVILQIAEFVNHTNKDMSIATNALSGAVRELSDLYENGKPPNNRT